jgi:hypothetical protein
MFVYSKFALFAQNLHGQCISQPPFFPEKRRAGKETLCKFSVKLSTNCVNLCNLCVNQKAQKLTHCKLSKLVFKTVKHGANPDISQNIIGANSVHTGFVQVPLQLHCCLHLHLHVVLEEAAAERGLIVGHFAVRRNVHG